MYRRVQQYYIQITTITFTVTTSITTVYYHLYYYIVVVVVVIVNVITIILSKYRVYTRRQCPRAVEIVVVFLFDFSEHFSGSNDHDFLLPPPPFHS